MNNIGQESLWLIVAGVVVGMIALYAARTSMHALLRALVRAVSQPLRLLSRWLHKSAVTLRARNREVLLAQGEANTRQQIEKEFERVTTIVRRDLQGYPALQRRLLDELTRIEEDYRRCGEVPPPPPEWTEAIAAIAKIRPGADGLVEKILGDIRDSLDKIYARVVAEYRRSYESRHKILKGFLPFWRSLDQTFQRVDRRLTGLDASAARIDSQIERYREIQSGKTQAERALASSATIQFVIAGLVMLVAIGGAFVNYKLIALPMSAMVGGGDYLTENLRASEVAALVLIFFETLMGLFLMEALRFSHLFPLHHLTETMRRRFALISFTILLVLAGVEVALAVMRDTIVAVELATRQALSGAEAVTAVAADQSWVMRIPAAGQMILGFTLPFALAFVAIPLEYFLNASRTVVGSLLVLSLHGLGALLRALANILNELGKVLGHLYDAIIVLPLFIERLVSARRRTVVPGGRPSVVPVANVERTP
jgi:hypothetical protein